MGNHLIEDCSSFSVLILLLSWFFYAVYGSTVLAQLSEDRHCYAKPGNNSTPLGTLPVDLSGAGYEDVTEATR